MLNLLASKEQQLVEFIRTHLCVNAKGLALLILIVLPTYLGSTLWENASWNNRTTAINLNSLYRYVLDPSGTQDVEDIRNKPESDWLTPANEKMNFGFNSSIFWLKAQFNAPESGPYLLEIPYSLLKSVEIRVYQNNTLTHEYFTGINRGFHSRPIEHRNFLFPITFQTHQPVTLLIKVQSNGFLKLSSRLWPEEDFYKKDQITNLVQGAYFGTLIIVIIYNLLALLSLFNITQFWFVIYGSLFIFFQVSMQGFGHQLFWPESPEFQNLTICIPLMAAGITGCLFAYSFLELTKEHYKTNAVFTFFCVCILLLFLGYSFFSYSIILRLQILVNVTLATFFIVIGLHQWQKGGVKMANFIFAWLIIVLSILLDGIEKMGFVSNLAELLNLSSDIELLQLVSVIEVILLSFALGDKISHERKKGMLAQHELLRIKSEQTQLLEINVDKRTQELQNALSELANVNEKLNSQTNTDTLTGTYNRHFFIQYFESWEDNFDFSASPFSLVLFDVDHFKDINDNYGHLFGDHCLIYIAKIMQSNLRDNHSNFLCRYGGEEFALLLPDTDAEEAMEIAERLRLAVAEQPATYENITSKITVSAGIATIFPDAPKDAKWLFEKCDQALYEAKNSGRNQVSAY